MVDLQPSHISPAPDREEDQELVLEEEAVRMKPVHNNYSSSKTYSKPYHTDIPTDTGRDKKYV